MILAASCRLEAADFGAVVSQRLSAGGLPTSERTVLQAMGSRHGVVPPNGIDEGVPSCLPGDTAAQRFAVPMRDRLQHDGWLLSNVVPVLEDDAGWPGMNTSRSRRALETENTHIRL
jgi:hypothetical protein